MFSRLLWRHLLFTGGAALACLVMGNPIFPPAVMADEADDGWTSLFDGRSLEGWRVVEYGGEGEIEVVDGEIRMDRGVTLTGIRRESEFPTSNFEIRLQAKRVDGTDFFCGLTFPVGESHCTYILGGWGGSTIGLSNIDGKDASENDTTQYRRFEKEQWYHIRVRVTDERIQAWIDDDRIIDQDIRDRRISTRAEVELSRPLGISAWETRSALKGIEFRAIESP